MSKAAAACLFLILCVGHVAAADQAGKHSKGSLKIQIGQQNDDQAKAADRTQHDAASRINSNLTRTDSGIRDPDMAEETQNHTKSKVLMDAGRAALQQSNPSSQQARQLIR